MTLAERPGYAPCFRSSTTRGFPTASCSSRFSWSLTGRIYVSIFRSTRQKVMSLKTSRQLHPGGVRLLPVRRTIRPGSSLPTLPSNPPRKRRWGSSVPVSKTPGTAAEFIGENCRHRMEKLCRGFRSFSSGPVSRGTRRCGAGSIKQLPSRSTRLGWQSSLRSYPPSHGKLSKPGWRLVS